MMKEFQNLKKDEIELLFKAPALVSILAASMDDQVDQKEKKTAIELSHLRTFTTSGRLQEYYKEAEGRFEQFFEQLDRELPQDTKKRSEIISQKLKQLDKILDKVDEYFAKNLKHSLETYKDHVSKAHRNALELFILPMNVRGVTD